MASGPWLGTALNFFTVWCLFALPESGLRAPHPGQLCVLWGSLPSSELGIVKMLTGSRQRPGCLVTGPQIDLTYMRVGWEGGFFPWASDCPHLVAPAHPKRVDRGDDRVGGGLGREREHVHLREGVARWREVVASCGMSCARLG